MNLSRDRKGFTIVELLIVIVVIAILAAISVVAYNGVQERARNSSALTLASQIAKKAEVYYAVNGTYPTVAANFTGESALEGMKVTFGNTGQVAAYPVAGNFNSVAAAQTQFNTGSRVIYVASSTGYSIVYRTGSATYATMSKGTPPSGTYAWVSNENV